MSGVAEVTENLPVKMSEKNAALAVIEQNPAVVLTDGDKFDILYNKLKADVAAHVPDLTTKKGRGAIASLAYNVTRTKTAIDDAGKALNEAARKQIAAVDEARRQSRERLDALAKRARQPLTEWEQAEEDRLDACKTVLAELTAAAVVRIEDTSETVEDRLERVSLADIDEDRFQELHAAAAAAKQNAIDVLLTAAERLRQAEAERAELEKLRAEAVLREAADAKREAEAAAERERVEAEQRKAEQERQAAAQEAERVRLASERAAEEARLEAERKAEQARAEQERQHEAELRRIRDEQAARERAEAAEKLAAVQAEAEAQRRAADRTHQIAVMKRAKEALMLHALLTEDGARDAVKAIAAGKIPAVHLQF